MTDKSNKMWGGRFSMSPAEIMQEINVSIDFDKALAPQDIRGSKAHAAMLAEAGIITKADAREIIKGLDQVFAEIEAGTFKFSRQLEDVHMNVESRLKDMIGAAAGRLHTARSRNDQVATDFRLYVRDQIDGLDGALAALQLALATKAEAHAATVMPGFTHLQPAQPVTFGHHLLAYVEMISRDRGRLSDARKRLNESPLGSAALAGTSFPIDRHMTAEALGFDRPMANSLDGVSDRDFALETLSSATICAIHMSRLAEEIVIWMTPQFGFVKLSDKFTTGSSIMPQKRNPDAAELIRAKAARIGADFAALNAIVQKLPLAYAKDLQEDKALTFGAFDTFALCLTAMVGMIDTISFHRAPMREAASRGFSTATDLADWLVRALKIPFREAHETTGKIVRRAEGLGIADLADLPLGEFQAVEPRITESAQALLSVEKSVESRDSYGGTAPERVREQIARWKEMFA